MADHFGIEQWPEKKNILKEEAMSEILVPGTDMCQQIYCPISKFGWWFFYVQVY